MQVTFCQICVDVISNNRHPGLTQVLVQTSNARQLISLETTETGASLARDSCESLRAVVSFSSPSFMAPLKHPATYGLSPEVVPPGLAPPSTAAKTSKGGQCSSAVALLQQHGALREADTALTFKLLNEKDAPHAQYL